MAKYSIQMIGIMYFHVCNTEQKRVLIPKGTDATGHIPPHYASLFVEKELCKYIDWWPGFVFERNVMIAENGSSTSIPTLEFRIPERVQLTFEDETSGAVQVGNLERRLHRNDDPRFELDLESPDTIADVPIRGGRLEAFTFGRGHAVQWSLERPGPMTFRAVSQPHGTRKGQVTVLPSGGARGSEILLIHSPAIFPDESRCRGSHAHSPEASHARPTPRHDAEHGLHHYKLYAKLDRNRDESTVNFTPSLPHRLGIVNKVIEAELNNSCTPDCC